MLALAAAFILCVLSTVPGFAIEPIKIARDDVALDLLVKITSETAKAMGAPFKEAADKAKRRLATLK
mgnify:CR=1 FL=1